MYKKGFGINNLQWFICYKTQTKQIIAQSVGIVEKLTATLQMDKSVLDMRLNNLMVSSSNSGALGNTENPLIAIAPGSTLARRGSTW